MTPTFRDAGLGHDLDVILMRAKAQVCHAAQRLHRITAIRDKDISLGLGEFHSARS